MDGNACFIALLKGGAEPKSVAKKCASAFVLRSNETNEIDWKFAACFIKDCFGAINFKLEIKEQDIREFSQHSKFAWNIDDIKRYIFIYEEKEFRVVEKFFFQLTREIQEMTDLQHENTTMSTENENDTPIWWYTILLTLWLKICNNLKEQKVSTEWFNEPIARIDYQFLRGFLLICETYLDDAQALHKLCIRLFKNVLRGILYPETHKWMISGLIEMLHSNFHIFCKHINPNEHFYRKILTAKVDKSIHKDIFKALSNISTTYCISYSDFNNEENQEMRQNSLEVSNFLIHPSMLNIYYHYLTKENNLNILLALLEFLNELQGKLLAIDCFPDAFIEAILSLVFHDNVNIGDLSAKAYVAIMKRRTDDKSIYVHCVKMYFTYQNNSNLLLRYVRRLWTHIGLTENADIFVEPIRCVDQENEKFRIWGAHFLCAFVEYLMEGYETNRIFIIQLLEKIIRSLHRMKCLVTQDILLEIFIELDKKELPNKTEDLKTLFTYFEKCAEMKFLSNENFQYTLLKKWFVLYEKYAKYSENLEQVKLLCLNVGNECTNIVCQMESQSRVKFLSKAEVEKYSCALQKLCILSATNYEIHENVDIFNALYKNLLSAAPDNENATFHKYAEKYKMLIDVYGIELYFVYMTQVFNSKNEENHVWLKEKLQEFERHLINWLRNEDISQKQPMVRIKTYFNCLLAIYMVFGSSPKDNILCLTTLTYVFLIRTLVRILFKSHAKKYFNDYAEDIEVNPLRSVFYEQSMIQYLTELHTFKYIDINDHFIWHICLYYGLPSATKFKDQLHKLLLTLAQHKMHIFKRAIPIAIYNLYTQQPALSESSILRAIKAHKFFIDGFIDDSIENPAFLNCHVVFEVIGIVKKALQVRANSGDRLSPLNHLNVFLRNLNLSSEICKELKREASELRSLRENERKSLSNFLKMLDEANGANGGEPQTAEQEN